MGRTEAVNAMLGSSKDTPAVLSTSYSKQRAQKG